MLAGVDTERFRPQAHAIARSTNKESSAATGFAFSPLAHSHSEKVLWTSLRWPGKCAVAPASASSAIWFARPARCGESVPGSIEFVPRVPELELTTQYSWADIFLFPTIEDGFAVVVAQAQASGLPVITTPNGSGPDLITPGVERLDRAHPQPSSDCRHAPRVRS